MHIKINNKYLLMLLAGMMFTMLFQACKKSKSDIGKQLAEVTKNKVFKDVTAEGYADAFKKALANRKNELSNSAIIGSYYEQNDYEPVLILNHLKNNDLKALTDRLGKSQEHGLKPEIFMTDALKALLAKLNDKKAIKTVDDAYQTMAQLELLTANSLIKYSNAMQYGLISPRKIYSRYFAETLRPDSASMKKVLEVKEIKTYLDSIQPKDPQYVALQKAYAQGTQLTGLSKEESDRYYAVNLERLRWKNKPEGDKYVIVNIPDYRLDVMEGGKSALNMKVCVGEGRNMENETTLTEYDESDKVDRPFSRETPQLNSQIYTVQVNPVWNIPESIATKEIMVEAAQDRYYLDNKGIDVYEGGRKVEDPETIDWASAPKNKYEFKQRPSDQNSLGKIKFLFKNNSSVYLHDTPAKNAFNQNMRAVSHGCVRVEEPQKLAQALFGDGEKYQKIVEKMNGDNESPTNIDLPKKVPVYLTYVTCWVDDAGKIQVRPDVYGLDVVLYAYMKRSLTA